MSKKCFFGRCAATFITPFALSASQVRTRSDLHSLYAVMDKKRCASVKYSVPKLSFFYTIFDYLIKSVRFTGI